LNLLEKIQSLFGVGNIYIKKITLLILFLFCFAQALFFCFCFLVQSNKDLEIIIKHFDNYPLISNKFADYELFKRALELIKKKIKNI